ncbi:Uncharacterized protein BM_BM10335 [Brugia malayi]|uniref:Bm10335 n=1 Tax=Brugia malayi TaxID=6279 RepID=A0A0H5S8Y6_BRUMA|nr:Uncharacterized protein BM_BM10335 [Brugia malayi]CRZ24824.1 Bm10335 [Brugia malayi]VIO93150.1 Uncharacterized protein BM_BM10335 [Brugia malayi]
MKLFKIALLATLMQIIKTDNQEDMNEKTMNENLTLLDDCEEIMELDESVEQQIVPEILAVKTSRNTENSRNTKISRNTENSSVINDKFFDTKTSNDEFIKPFTSSQSQTNEMDKMNNSTTANIISLTVNDIMNASLNSKIDKTFEIQLSVDKNDNRNETDISMIDSIYLTEEESITFCQKTLTCEEKLKWHELMCQRKYAYPNLIIESETKLFDMSVQSEFIINSEVANVMESVSKVCLRPITSDILRQLSKLLRKMELNRKLCMRQTISSQNPLPINNKMICEKMVTDDILNGTNDVDKCKFNNLETRQNALDYCRAITAPMRKQCTTLRQCCPNYASCTELMLEMNTSKKYEELLKHTKQIQSNCEKKIMATLQSLHSAFLPFT